MDQAGPISYSPAVAPWGHAEDHLNSLLLWGAPRKYKTNTNRVQVTCFFFGYFTIASKIQAILGCLFFALDPIDPIIPVAGIPWGTNTVVI